MAVFDKLKDSMYATVNSTMGEQATWISADALANYTGLVLYNDPTIKELVDGSGFIPETPYFKYNTSLIPGLKIRVDKNGSQEMITISVRGVNTDFYITSVDLLTDGGEGKAYLKQVSDPYGPQNQTL